MRAGFQPVTADLFADSDLRAFATTTRISPYPEGFVDWLRTIEPPAWMYTGALENHPELVDQMAWIAPLWGNPGDVLERVRSPWELARTLRDAGLLFPETRDSAAGLPLDGTWLTKTYRGASGSGVRTLSMEHGARSTEIPLPDREGLGEGSSIVVQRRVAGTACSAAFVAVDGAAELLGVTRQLIGEAWLGAHGFQYAGSIGPLPIDEAARRTIEHIGNVLAEQFELGGIFGVDFVLNVDGVWTIEVNPRYTASVEIVERATGVNAIKLHACVCRGEAMEENVARAGRRAPSAADGRARIGGEDAPARSGARVHAKAILFAKRDVQISESFAYESLAEAMITPWPTLADVSPAGTMIEAGRPILTVFAEGTSVGNVEQRLRQRVAELEQQIYGSDVPS